MGFKSGKMSSSPASSQTSFVKDDKWKLASQLQKAIRHGKVDDAVQAAHDLDRVEPSYLRYRLSVIAVEDVGAGSPDVVLDAFSSGWKKQDIEARGGIDFLSQTAASFASSVKDRTACDLMYATRFVSDFEAIHGLWSDLTWDVSSTIALDENQPWWARSLAAWRCAGTDRFQARTEILPRVEGDWERWVALNTEAYGKTAAGLMRAGENQREHHHVFMGIAMSARSEGVYYPALPDLPKVGPWLSAALDKHTSEGKRALRLLPSLNPEASQVLSNMGLSSDEQVDLAGRMWFWMEGGRCDKERAHAMARNIRNDNQSRVLGNIPPTVLIEAFGDTELWQRARQKALGVTSFRPRAGLA